MGASGDAIFAAAPMQQWIGRMEEAGCICAPIATLPEVCADKQLRANGAFAKITHPVRLHQPKNVFFKKIISRLSCTHQESPLTSH